MDGLQSYKDQGSRIRQSWRLFEELGKQKLSRRPEISFGPYRHLRSESRWSIQKTSIFALRGLGLEAMPLAMICVEGQGSVGGVSSSALPHLSKSPVWAVGGRNGRGRCNIFVIAPRDLLHVLSEALDTI